LLQLFRVLVSIIIIIIIIKYIISSNFNFFPLSSQSSAKPSVLKQVRESSLQKYKSEKVKSYLCLF